MKVDISTSKNHTKKPDDLTRSCMITLKKMIAEEENVTYELIQRCENPQHKFTRCTEIILEKNNLISNGIVHEYVKNVVLFALESEQNKCFDCAIQSFEIVHKKEE